MLLDSTLLVASTEFEVDETSVTLDDVTIENGCDFEVRTFAPEEMKVQF